MLDAPPTGRITQFLNVNDELAGLAKVGPIKSQADTVMTLFRSPRTAVHLVTVLEEMPVQETADGIAELRARAPAGRRRRRQPGPAARPRHRRPRRRPAPATLDRAQVAADLAAGRASTSTTSSSTALLAEARDHAERRALEDAQRAVVGRPRTCRRTSCPGCPAGVDLGGLYELAALLKDQGMA